MEKEYFTPQEAAEIWRVSVQTVLRLIKAGRLRAIQVGRQWRIKKENLNDARKEE